MSLDDTDSIDIVLGPTPHARLTLVIADGDSHADEGERLAKFAAKLKVYVGYVLGPQFGRDHPGVGPADVLIGVVCRQPPSEQMLGVTEVRPRGRPEAAIRVAVARQPSPGEVPWFLKNEGQQ